MLQTVHPGLLNYINRGRFYSAGTITASCPGTGRYYTIKVLVNHLPGHDQGPDDLAAIGIS